jgi:2-C-methyl-D-erythritol 4-phosphate cytidylyltransferase
MLAWSLLAFDDADAIDAIVVAAPPGDEGRVSELAEEAGVEVAVVPGADFRSQSVANALDEVKGEVAVVHDAARPLVAVELIEAIVRRLERDKEAMGVVAAAPVSDTIKEASASRRVLRTPDRSRLWAAQTPQAFRTDALRDALAAGGEDLAKATDDAMLVERMGGEVLIHSAPPENLKVTTPLDLKLAELILAERLG